MFNYRFFVYKRTSPETIGAPNQAREVAQGPDYRKKAQWYLMYVKMMVEDTRKSPNYLDLGYVHPMYKRRWDKMLKWQLERNDPDIKRMEKSMLSSIESVNDPADWVKHMRIPGLDADQLKRLIKTTRIKSLVIDYIKFADSWSNELDRFESMTKSIGKKLLAFEEMFFLKKILKKEKFITEIANLFAKLHKFLSIQIRKLKSRYRVFIQQLKMELKLALKKEQNSKKGKELAKVKGTYDKRYRNFSRLLLKGLKGRFPRESRSQLEARLKKEKKKRLFFSDLKIKNLIAVSFSSKVNVWEYLSKSPNTLSIPILVAANKVLRTETLRIEDEYKPHLS